MVIPEINSIEAKDLFIAGVASRPDYGTDNINAILNEVRALLETINISISGSENSEDYPLGQIIKNIESVTSEFAVFTENLFNDIAMQLDSILSDVGLFTNKLIDPTGTVMAVLDAEGDFYSSLESSMVSLAGIIDSLDKTAQVLPSQLPQILVLIAQVNVALDSINDVLEALSNNPLLRGGIPGRQEAGPGGASPRNIEF